MFNLKLISHTSRLCSFDVALGNQFTNHVFNFQRRALLTNHNSRKPVTPKSANYFLISNTSNWRQFFTSTQNGGLNVSKLTLTIGGLLITGMTINYLRKDGESVVNMFTRFLGNSEQDKKTAKNKRNLFRDRKIIEYENRIRNFSTPDKIFRYFATIKVIYEDGNESEVFMTPDDFLRAVTPGIKQPENLGLEQFRKIELDKGFKLSKELTEALRNIYVSVQEIPMDFGLKPDSTFYKLSNFGLINYSDFLFLLTLLSVSYRHFKIAFRMFDLNGDGNVDYGEFEKVQNAILHQTSVGKKLGSAIKTNYRGVSSALAKYFFGPDLSEKLTIQKFLDFQKQLQEEMLTLEFDRKKPRQDGKISESKFSELLITYAGFPEKKRVKMLKRIKKAYPDAQMDDPGRGITLDDYLTFHHFLQNINDVDIALTFYNIAGASIDEDTLKHAARTVAYVDLRDHLIKVIFILFDENQDGQLSNKEFISVMKERLKRGLGRPKDTGLFKVLGAIWNALKMDIF